MKIDDIRQKVEKMDALLTVLSKDNQVLRSENTELKRELGELKARLKRAETAAGLSDGLTAKRAKMWLHEILREIDECKRIINR